jgi:hypothetical protein
LDLGGYSIEAMDHSGVPFLGSFTRTGNYYNGHKANRQGLADGEILDAYQWLASQMEQRIGGRPHADTLPLWAWYQWYGEKRKRPDLRSFDHIPSGQKGVRIEFETEDHLVILSDFDLWHAPLNRGYLGASDEDTERFYEETEGLSHDQLHADPFYRQQIVNSWPRIFDLDWKNENLRIQATFWQLNMQDVRDVTVFIAR